MEPAQRADGGGQGGSPAPQLSVHGTGLTPVTLAGPVRGAEWRLTSFVWGGDEQVKPNRSWKARRS